MPVGCQCGAVFMNLADCITWGFSQEQISTGDRNGMASGF